MNIALTGLGGYAANADLFILASSGWRLTRLDGFHAVRIEARASKRVFWEKGAGLLLVVFFLIM